MDSVITNAITASTLEVFTTMLSDEPLVGQSYEQKNAGGIADGVVSVVGLTGDWIGTGMITCSASLACRLSSLLLLSEHTPGDEAVTEEVLDATAEITNMIIGNVKNMLEDEVGELSLSIPTVVYGKNLTTRSMNEGEWIVVPFTCSGEELHVKLCLAPNTRRVQKGSFGLTHSLTS
jgi:chemotaxis protein CheX